jgi:phage antirepressor YoqD-like protein
MSDLQPLQPTMTSREIAELTGKRHDNVRADIAALAQTLSLTFQEKAEASDGGRPSKVYLLQKRETLILVSGYSVQMRARIIDRWQELEAAAAAPVALPDLSNPAMLRGLLLNYTERVLALENQVQADAPKVAFAEAVGAAESDQKTKDVAKALGIGPRKLLAFMKDNGILMRDGLPFQHHMECGRFRVVEVPYTDGAGAPRLRLQTRVTGKGVTFLQQKLARAHALATVEASQ